jgi:hypothetical protein
LASCDPQTKILKFLQISVFQRLKISLTRLDRTQEVAGSSPASSIAGSSCTARQPSSIAQRVLERMDAML